MNEQRMSLQEALEMLTVGEVGAIERHYGKAMENGISGTDLSAATVWAHERRKNSKFDWKDIEKFTMKALNDYFEPEAVEVDETTPESEQGKGDSLAA